tara:strand:+ start:682 stop:1056 length:375 start_codon:yes stop_codon:yes gene_type:complete
MAEPDSKKVKVENGEVNNGKQPIVFAVPHLSVPDVRLTVMDQQFMVHSAILKSKSGFFDEIFEWPGSVDWLDKAPYKYDLVTRGSSKSDWILQIEDKSVSIHCSIAVVSATHYTDLAVCEIEDE